MNFKEPAADAAAQRQFFEKSCRCRAAAAVAGSGAAAPR